MKTERGFEVNHFKDTYGFDCSIQDSSLATDDRIWLGVHNAPIKIMKKDIADWRMCDIIPDDGMTNEYGWCTVKLPVTALVESRMHLNRKQARELAEELLYFADNGHIKEHERYEEIIEAE